MDLDGRRDPEEDRPPKAGTGVHPTGKGPVLFSMERSFLPPRRTLTPELGPRSFSLGSVRPGRGLPVTTTTVGHFSPRSFPLPNKDQSWLLPSTPLLPGPALVYGGKTTSSSGQRLGPAGPLYSKFGRLGLPFERPGCRSDHVRLLRNDREKPGTPTGRI